MKMATAFKKLRNIIGSPNDDQVTGNVFFDPELGFKVSLHEQTKELKVTIIAARHLPTLYGLTRTEGYVVKVKLFPGKETFETKMQKESWPAFNQEFSFHLQTNANRIEDQLCGKFVVLTVYAILETHQKHEGSSSTKRSTLSSTSFKFLFKKGNELNRSESAKTNNRVSLYKRRTVGAITYNLDHRGFTQKLRNNWLGTPDVWREVKPISSGLVDDKKNKENNKGALELTMNYSESEDGKHDMISLSISRLRFSIQTMETHENHAGFIYVKMKIFEHDVIVAKWKSQKFEPTISLKLEPESATLQGTVQNVNLDSVRCEIRLMCKNKLGKKTELGNVIIKPKDGHWEQALDMPSNPVTLWHNFK